MAIPSPKHLLIRFTWPLLLFFPLEAFSQTSSEDSSEEQRQTFADYAGSRKFGGGVRMNCLTNCDWNYHTQLPVFFELRYTRYLEHFALRGGLGGVDSRIFMDQDGGRSSILRSYVGIQKNVWQIGERFFLNASFDLGYRYKSEQQLVVAPPSGNMIHVRSHSVLGRLRASLDLRISDRFSVSLGTGTMARYWRKSSHLKGEMVSEDQGFNYPTLDLPRWLAQIERGRLIDRYTLLVNYHF